MTEEWRKVPSIPVYEVSSLGRVKSWHPQSHTARPRTEGRLLKPGRDRGYLYIQARCKESGVFAPRYVHRLVLEAFVGPCPEGMECRHLNGNRSDNRLENLCWGTAAENTMDKFRHGTVARGPRGSCDWQARGERHGRSKLSEHAARNILSRGVAGEDRARLASEHNVSVTTIRDIIAGRKWKHLRSEAV